MHTRVVAEAMAAHQHDYSVRLAGMLLWDEHLSSFEVAQQSAAEPRALGLEDVHIIDEETGECLE